MASTFVGLDPSTHTAAVFTSPEGTWRIFHLPEKPRFPALFTRSSAAVLVNTDPTTTTSTTVTTTVTAAAKLQLPLAGTVAPAVATACCCFPVDNRARMVVRVGTDVEATVCRNGEVAVSDADFVIRGPRQLLVAERVDAKVGLALGCENPDVELLASARSLARARLLFERHVGTVQEVQLDNGLRATPTAWEAVWEADKDSQLRLTKLCDLVVAFTAATDLAGVVVRGQMAKLLANTTMKRRFPLQPVVVMDGLRAEFAAAVGAAVLAARSRGAACMDTIDYDSIIVENIPEM